MAVFEYARSVSEGASLFTRVSSFVYHLVGTVVDWNDARATRSALSSLSNEELDDIGLVRADINEIR